MNEKNNLALVPRTSGALEKAEPGARRILSGMAADNRIRRASIHPRLIRGAAIHHDRPNSHL